MRSRIPLSWLILCVPCFFCGRTPDRIRIGTADDGLAVRWGGGIRMAGGMLSFQDRTAGFTHARKVLVSDNLTFSFENDSGSAEVRIQFNEKRTIAGFFMSPNGLQSPRGDAFMGLFFNGFPGYRDGVAFYRYGPWKAWTKPVRVPDPGRTEKDDIQFFLWRYADGTYAAAMPMGGAGYRSTFGSENSRFGVKSICLKDSLERESIPLFAVGFGMNPYRLIEDLYENGMGWMGHPENRRKLKSFPAQFEGVGWCTYNALGGALNPEAVIKSVASFTQKGFPLSYLLVDDGWLNAGADKKLRGFDPDPRKFPRGFKPMISLLKTEYGIRDVGLWQTLNGYWNGVELHSTLGRKYRDVLMPYHENSSPEWFYTPSPRSDSAFAFFDEWHSRMKNDGVSFVKVDNQLVVERIAKNRIPVWDAAEGSHRNLARSIEKHFDGAAINCMDMTTDALYCFGKTAVARAVEDYFPDETSYDMQKGNAAVHVLCAVMNSLWFSPMVWPDYDMFQSHHPYAEYHAVARAISGGPVYLTDTPGKQNFRILQKLIDRNGNLLRTDVPALPTEDCLFQVQDLRPFKAFSMTGECGLLGVWNAADADRVDGSFRPSDAPGVQGRRFAVLEHFSKQWKLCGRNEAIPLRLGRMECRLYWIVPVREGAALFGLIDKYNAPKTILRQVLGKKEIRALLVQGGDFAAVLPKAPKAVFVDGIGQPEDAYSFSRGFFEIRLPSKGGRENVEIQIAY
jgi:raffinose synthase